MKNIKYILPQKSELKQIKVNDINFALPDLKNITESKAIAIAKWLMHWIDCDKTEIGRASVGKECRSRWSPYH